MNRLTFRKSDQTFHGMVFCGALGATLWGFYSLDGKSCYLATAGEQLSGRGVSCFGEEMPGFGMDWEDVRGLLRGMTNWINADGDKVYPADFF